MGEYIDMDLMTYGLLKRKIEEAIYITKEVHTATTEEWNSTPELMTRDGHVYVYTDHAQDSEGNDIPGIKIGTGREYLIDAPFIDAVYAEHIVNDIIHITQEEREFWNDKVRCYIDENNDEKLIFTTH